MMMMTMMKTMMKTMHCYLSVDHYIVKLDGRLRSVSTDVSDSVSLSLGTIRSPVHLQL